MNRRIKWKCDRIAGCGGAVVLAMGLMVFARVGEVQAAGGGSLGADDPGQVLAGLPVATAVARAREDWLVQDVERRAGVYRGVEGQELILDNGLIRRTIRIEPNGATVGLDNLMTGEALLRSVKPEALVTLDGSEFEVGGLVGQPNHAYLRAEWVGELQAKPTAFRLAGLELKPTEALFGWQRRRQALSAAWPSTGVAVVLRYEAAEGLPRGVEIEVHYELYDGMPVLAKWLVVRNGGARPVRVDRFSSELLALAEVESIVDEYNPERWRKPWVDLISDYTFGGMGLTSGNRTSFWEADPEYTSQVNYNLKTPALLVSRPPIGPGVTLAAGESFRTFRSYLLVHDSDQRERQGLAIRRFHRVVAPWITENPLMMHVRSADRATFRNAVDQCAEVGFEMIIYTFGSGLNMENNDPEYLARIREDVEYAHAKGIEVGGYSLLASRRINDEMDVINPATGRPGGAIFGNSPCLGSAWGEGYFRRIKTFLEATKFDLLEHDGSYPGDVCASTNHPGHLGLADSQWRQWERITALYAWCRERGIYLNVPDNYFLNGSSKTGMGYREVNWSLPRAEQIIMGRQHIYDGTWEKTPSMGWMFVPLTEYHGGGAAATLEPLREHLAAYEAHLVNNLGAGVQACYRGPRLYDSEETRAMVKCWVDWFKEYREILESDVIHLRRADARDWDGVLHVNPGQARCGLAMLYNPLRTPMRRTVRLPLYYTGLTESARVREQGGEPVVYQLARDYAIEVPVTIPAEGRTWLVIEAP
jgi:hypothetical protein